MSIRTFSKFYYGYEITADNCSIDFNDGGADKVATLAVGTYSLTKLLIVTAAALNAASSVEWTVTVNRATRIITLTSASSTTVLGATGDNFSTSALPTLGLNSADHTGTTHVGATASGSSYSPGFLLEDYKDKTQTRKLINPTINKSTSKQKVSVQYFGVEQFYKFNIKWITNQHVGTSAVWRSSNTALEDAKSFLNWIMTKSIIEFMPDENDEATYDRMYLDSAEADADGVGFDLKEYFDKNLPGFYETGLLTFTVITTE